MATSWKLKDLTGQRFTRLLVLELLPQRSARGDRIYLCVCDCGTRKPVRAACLRRGTTKSCGCRRVAVNLERGRRMYKGDGVSALNAVYSKYVYGARKRGLRWEISPEQFKEITRLNCHYCGVTPEMVSKVKGGSESYYNGLDRVDNGIGYVVPNVVPCCWQCNHAKGTLTRDEFVAWLMRVHAHISRTT